MASPQTPTSTTSATSLSRSSSTSSTNAVVGGTNGAEDADSGPELIKGMVYKIGRRFPHAVLRRRRLVVLDRRLGRVFVVKCEGAGGNPGEFEVLEQVDVSAASFTMDHGDSGFFSVHLGNSSHEFDAITHEARVVWLQHLQRTRAGGLRRKGAREPKKSPILKSVDIESLPWIDDPVGDENGVSGYPPSTAASAARKKLEPEFAAFQEMGKRVARTIGFTNEDNNRVQFSEQKEENVHPKSSPPRSPVPGRTSFKNLGRRVRSFRLAVDGLPSKSLQTVTECRHCPKLSGRLRSVEEDLNAREVENSALRQSLEILRDQCDSLEVEKDNLEKIQELLTPGTTRIANDALELLRGGDILDILREKDSKILECEQRLQKVDELRRDLSAVRAQLETYEELVRVKDEAIVCLANGTSSGIPARALLIQQAAQTDMTGEEMKELFRMLTAANSRADFMNDEVVQCGKLLHDASKREEKAFAAAREWEAKFYQVQSKYLSLLNDFHAPPDPPSASNPGSSGDQSHTSRPEVISRLVQDVIDSQDERAMEARTPAGATRSGLYDELGFVHQLLDYAGQPRNETKESKLLSIRDRADDMKFEIAERDAPEWRAAWDAFLLAQDLTDSNLRYNPELKNLLRTGVPLRDRGRVWTAMIRSRVPESLLVNDKGVRYYHGLLTELWSRNKIDPVVKQIELDLPRTLPNNRHYESSRADGIPRLRRVLIAFSLHRPDVGYCQGLNRIAAVALLFMSEEDAFWTLCIIVDRLMPPEYYSRTLTGAQIDQRVLKDLLADKLPRLSAHLAEHNVDISLFTFNWFLCIFVDNVPTRTYLRIWDTFLFEGSKVLFRYAIAAFAMCEKDILALKDHVSIFNYMRNIGESLTDAQRLTEVAFNELNPFSMKLLRNLREKHAVGVKAQLDELEALRRDFKYKSDPVRTEKRPSIDGIRTDDDE